MLERLRKALVESFVGAIALGWVFAQGIFHFAYMFVAPVAHWLARREYRGLTDQTTAPIGFSLQDALPDLVKSFSLLVIGYVLLRWLYFKTLKEETTAPTPEQ
jgi:hypothetical protein